MLATCVWRMPCDAWSRKKHAEGHKYDGINAKKGSICNMYVVAIILFLVLSLVPRLCELVALFALHCTLERFCACVGVCRCHHLRFISLWQLLSANKLNVRA
jgi:hypothetical protein